MKRKPPDPPRHRPTWQLDRLALIAGELARLAAFCSDWAEHLAGELDELEPRLGDDDPMPPRDSAH